MLNAIEIGNVVFDTYEEIDLNTFSNIRDVNHLSLQTCQQIEAFAKLGIVESLQISGLHENCIYFSFPNMMVVSGSYSISGSEYLQSFSFPRLQYIQSLDISRNDNLFSIDDLSELLEVEKIQIIQNEKLNFINGFQSCNSTEEYSQYQIIIKKEVDCGNTFR